MTEQDFLAEILADRAADGPRLVFADWLSEQDDPRGEFIRVQCELALRPEQECGGLERREQQILEIHGAVWRKPIWRLGCAHLRFRRGFLHRVSTTTDALARFDSALAPKVPLIDALEIQCLTPEASDNWRKCLQSTTLSRVGTLMIRNSSLERYTMELGHSLFGEILRRYDDEIDPNGIMSLLFDAAANSRYHTLILNRVDPSRGEIRVIAHRGHELTQLRELHLGGNGIEDIEAEMIMESRLFDQLELLDLRWNRLSDLMREQLRDRFGNRILV